MTNTPAKKARRVAPTDSDEMRDAIHAALTAPKGLSEQRQEALAAMADMVVDTMYGVAERDGIWRAAMVEQIKVAYAVEVAEAERLLREIVAGRIPPPPGAH